MIEINLLPGATRRAARRPLKLPFALPRLGGAKKLDGMAALIVVGWLVGPGVALWLFLSTSSRSEELGLQIEQAVQDSTRYAALIASQERLQARRDTIAQKLEIIQEIDAGRYIWAHILDEVSRALPEYTWLTAIHNVETGAALPEFQIIGRTGNTFALTRFMRDLENSDFIHSVRLTTTEQIQGADARTVHEFILLATYEEPPADKIETIPLFRSEP